MRNVLKRMQKNSDFLTFFRLTKFSFQVSGTCDFCEPYSGHCKKQNFAKKIRENFF